MCEENFGEKLESLFFVIFLLGEQDSSRREEGIVPTTGRFSRQDFLSKFLIIVGRTVFGIAVRLLTVVKR